MHNNNSQGLRSERRSFCLLLKTYWQESDKKLYFCK